MSGVSHVSGERLDGGRRLLNVHALVGNLLHVLLTEAVADELPVPFERGAGDRLVRLDRAAVNREHGGNVQPVEDLEHAPEADAVSVFVPRPVGHVRHRRPAGRRWQDGTRQRLLRVPLFDVDDHPHREASTTRQHQARPIDDRRIREAFGREHGL
jgi:hypothetical protein